MKIYIKLLLVVCLSATIINGCTDRDDNLTTPASLEVQDFIWKGLNLYYLWQADVPDLQDNAFSNQLELNAFLATKGSPENLFEDLLFKPVSKFQVPQAVDRFSVIVNDYAILENQFQGISTSTGLNFGLRLKSGSTTEVFGWVRYVLPNSSAATNNMQRGMIFSGVNGTPLTTSNFNSLLGGNGPLTFNMANFAGGAITPNGISVTLAKTELNENPVFLTRIYNIGTRKVGYIVYNAFTSNYETQLNEAFGQLKTANVTHLVLDLRYNGGGSIRTASRLASMITGQFNDQAFAVEQWNSKVQAFFQANNPAVLTEKFTNTIGGGAAINSLNLSKVFILTSRRTASASELVINGLKPYITVDIIGDLTSGKNVGSITLYDSPSLGATNRNPNHKYAMQPLVLKTANKVGFSAYQDGIAPITLLLEDIGNLNQLGNVNEPLLAAALQKITAGGKLKSNDFKIFIDVSNSDLIKNPYSNEMYLEEIPQGLEKILREKK